MRTKGATGVGRFSVEIEIANYGDLTLVDHGLLSPDKVPAGRQSRGWSTPERRSWCYLRRS